jgi:hypothetical protein
MLMITNKSTLLRIDVVLCHISTLICKILIVKLIVFLVLLSQQIIHLRRGFKDHTYQKG